MNLPPCDCRICERARNAASVMRMESMLERTCSTRTNSTSSSASSSVPVVPYTTADLASLPQSTLSIDTNIPRPFASTLALSVLSTSSTDTAYSHLSYRLDSPITHWPDSSLTLTEVLTLSPENTDTEEAHLITTDDVPSLAETGTEEDLDLDVSDAEGTHNLSEAYSLASSWHVLDTTDEEWECVHVQDGLLPPPPSPVLRPRKANTLPLLSIPTSTLVTIVLLTLVTPSTSAGAPEANDANDCTEQSAMLPPPPPVAWIPHKRSPVWVALLLTLGIVLLFVRGPYVSKRTAVPELDVITRDDLVLLSVAPPFAASEGVVPMERTRRTSGYTRRRIKELDEGTHSSPLHRGIAPRAAAVAAGSAVLLASAGAASPVPSVTRLEAQPLRWPALALAAPVILTVLVWAFRSPARLDSTFTPRRLRRFQSPSPPITCSAAYISALAFVPAAVAKPTFTLALHSESSGRQMHPGAIAAIALGIVLAPFVLLTLAEVFGLRTHLPLRMGIVRTRLYRWMVIAAGLTLGLAIGLVITPFFAAYMLAVFVAAVTTSYGRWAGVDTSGWWQGQTTQWPARIVHAHPLPQTASLPDPAPDISPITPTEKGKSRLSLQTPVDAMPLPIYPPPVYARSVALVLLLALAVPCSAKADHDRGP